jgi:uncharacterized protein YndB with AHSA1/START domain
MSNSQFVYVTYIRTTAEKLWEALTSAEFNKKFWFGMHQESEWKPGAPWKLVFPDGRVADAGEVLEADKPKRLVVKWRNQFKPELTEEGYSRCTMKLEPEGAIVKLTIAHEIDKSGSKLIDAVGGGWPKVLASLKSLLETDEALEQLHRCDTGTKIQNAA